jgi:hypothetical protein
MTLFQDNLSPYLTVVEGSAPSSPGAGNQKLFIDSSDHLLKYKNSSGTVTTVGGGLSDPMTTRGDIIVRNASNVTARLAIGSSGKVLSSDGTDVSWQTPSSSGLITPSWVSVSSDVTGMNSTALADVTGVTTSITTGAHRVLVSFSGTLVKTGGSNGFALSVDIDGTQIGTVPWAYTTQGSNYNPVAFQVMSAVLSAASHTVKLRYKADSGTTYTLTGSAGTGIGNLFTVVETSLAV